MPVHKNSKDEHCLKPSRVAVKPALFRDASGNSTADTTLIGSELGLISLLIHIDYLLLV
jgi:hypothetical protein